MVRGVTVAAVLCLSTTAHAQGLDLDRWLDRSGVQLLAVEFYATWCKPCMKAVPRWKKLHDEYRRRGFRLVVVSVQDLEGGCFRLDWNPDEVICDDHGRIARRFGANKLPAAFLWNWRGELLSNHAQVEEVEAQVRTHYRNNPVVRVVVQDVARGSGLGHSQLRRLIKDGLKLRGKLEVALSAAQRDRIQKLRSSTSNKARCGQQSLTANSELEASTRLVQGRHRLQFGLLSADRGCMVASTVVDFNPKRPEQSVAEALDELMGHLRPQVQLPYAARIRAPSRKSVDKRIGETRPREGDDWNPESEEMTIVRFSSKPPGAVVMLDGKLICQDSSKGCDRSVSVGSHTLSMQKEGYLERTESLTIKKGKNITWALKKNTARLSVTSAPSGLNVKMDGRGLGQTPLSDLDVVPGVHEVVITSPCHYDTGTRLTLKVGEQHKLHETLKARVGAMRVTANAKRNAVRAEVYVDGVKLGQTPGVFKVTTCAKALEVRHEKYATWHKDISVKERQTLNLQADLQAPRTTSGKAGLTWIYSKPTKLRFTKSEVTVEQYEACVRAGRCARKNYKTKRDFKDCNFGRAGRRDHPMNCVDHTGADQFCSWANGRLPTKDEWYAEASNKGTREYPWGDAAPSCERAVMKEDGPGCDKESTWPVCSKNAGHSVSGLCDLSGNVWEWVQTSVGGRRVVRGGSLYEEAASLSANGRYFFEDGEWRTSLGFRCVSSSNRTARRLTRAQIARAIGKHLSAMRLCIRTVPREGISFQIQLSVRPNGRTSKVRLGVASGLSTAARRCIVKQAHTWRFPSFTGKPMRVNYPIRIR